MAFLDEIGATILADEVKTYVGNTAVAKETGKGLSTNDYTTTEKNKLAGIATGANKTIVDSALNTSSTNPVQNKVIYTEFEKKLDKDGDSKDLTNTFVSQDSTNVTQWTDVEVLTSAEKHSSVFNKISTMFKNIRYLYHMLGTADISTLGEGANIGTVTGALSKLNSDFNSKLNKISMRDVSTYDPVTIIQNKWGSDINNTGCYFISTSIYTYCVLVMYITPEYGTATIFGYALDTSAVNHGRMFNGTWHWDTLV